MNGDNIHFQQMKNLSVSLLSLLLLFALFSPASSWCYKTYFSVQGDVATMDISPDNAFLAITATSQNAVMVYDLANYNMVLNYVPSSGTVTCARFTKDGIYLGIGNNNGTIILISGKPTFNTTVLFSFATGKAVSDLDFNSASFKMLVCYSNAARYDIYSNYSGATTSASTTITSNIIRCKFSANDDIGFIDTGSRIKIYRAATNVQSTGINTGSNFKNFDIKPTSNTPIKFIGCGNDSKSYYAQDTNPASMTANLFTLTTSPSGTMTPICYGGDGTVYAAGGGGSDPRVFIFNDIGDSLLQVFNDNSNPSSYPLLSCKFTPDSSYLFFGTAYSSTYAMIYVYKKNCYDCPSGYYLSASTTCTLCNSGGGMMAVCTSCASASICNSCMLGYYLNLTTQTCSKCDYGMEGCSTCANSTYCYECNMNYVLNSSNRCQACSSIQTGCLVCNTTILTNNASCFTCATEFYLNSTGMCIRCNNTKANCLRCSSSSTCIQCVYGFYASGGNCLSCSSNCTSCYNSATNCSSCVRGFYPTPPSTCSQCASYCLECSAYNSCFDCQAGYYLSSNGYCYQCSLPCDTCNMTSCLNCIIGYYLNGTSCYYCGANCTSCLSQTNCSSCSIGYYLTAANTCLNCKSLFAGCSTCNLTQCFSCQVSSYLNSSNACVSCVTGGCLVCNSSSSCQACAIGYYLNTTLGCSTCASPCQSCTGSSTFCSSCIPGYYLSGTNCIPCYSTCQTCNSTICFSCVTGAFLISTSCYNCITYLYACTDCINNTYCLSCQIGRYLNSSNLCVDCSPSCGSCNSTACLSCVPGYYLNSTNSCVKCLNNCTECSSAGSCFACNPGFYLNGSQCASCWAISRGCLTCTQSVCFNCQLGYYMNSSNFCSSCQTSVSNCLHCLGSASCQACVQGYYLASATSCIACNSAMEGCQSCSSNTVCLICAVGYYLNGNSCIACANKCMSCNSTGCLTCSFRYSYNGSDCITCSILIPHCEICNNTSSCLRCFEGFYLSSASCLSCQSALLGCSYCNSSSICTTCMSGYYLNINSCSLCSLAQGCKLCSSSSVCTDCLSGYALSGSTCVTCSSLIPNCTYCSSPSTCIQCATGFYVNLGSCSTCKSAIPGCIQCSNGTQCLLCEGGYYLNGLICSACSVQGCEICTGLAPTQCVNCFSGYYQSGNSCLSCTLEGCLDCNQSSTCLSCQLGYYLNSSSGCSLCSVISGCSKCSSASVCTECQTLYYLSGSSCTPCSASLGGCAFCTNSSSCLSCSSGYYLNSSSLCSLCTSLTGCLLCSDMSTCTYCNSGYYLSGGSCFSCSSISQCAQCSNSITCSACVSGYALSGSTCTVISTSSSSSNSSSTATTQINNLKLKTFYVSSSSLKHVLYSVGMTYTQVTADWATNVKLYVGNKSSSTLLTISSTEWGKPNELIFYTNNPLTMNINSLPFLNRLLIGQTATINVNSSIQITQPLLAKILPNMLTDNTVTLGYNLNDPEFYNSYISAVYNSYYYIIGIIITCVLFFNFLMKAFCTVIHSSNLGSIMGHVFALKTISISLYPTFGQYINYCYGFMTADLPWANYLISNYLVDSSDYTPVGFLLYYSNMTIFSMYLIPLIVFVIILGSCYLLMGKNDSSDFKLEKTARSLKLKSKSRFKAAVQFFLNFFYFGLVFAGCASLQGSILNPNNIISLNGLGYVIGILVYLALFVQCFNSAYNNWNFQRLRLFVKATLLSLAHFNPIYIVAVVLALDISLIIVEVRIKSKFIVNLELFVANQILVNVGLAIYYYFPDSLLGIYTSAATVCIVTAIQIVMHYFEAKIPYNKYPVFNKEEYLNTQKPLSNEDSSWKINLEDYTLEKEMPKSFVKEHDESGNNPLIGIPDYNHEINTRNTNFVEAANQQALEKNNRRVRKFRESTKGRNTSLNSSWASFDASGSS